MSYAEISKKQIEKKYFFTILACAMYGNFGIHRFINGKKFSGIAMFLTCGGLGMWVIVDLMAILHKEFKDSDGRIITSHSKNSTINIIASAFIVIRFLLALLFMMFIIL